MVHYGDSVSTFLLNLQAADDRGSALTYISAVAVEEKQILDYNRGNPSGDPAKDGKHLFPAVPLAAVYPKEGTPFVTSPSAIFADAPHPNAARVFENFLFTAKCQQLIVNEPLP